VVKKNKICFSRIIFYSFYTFVGEEGGHYNRFLIEIVGGFLWIFGGPFVDFLFWQNGNTVLTHEVDFGDARMRTTAVNKLARLSKRGDS